jgi:hypothetical protein
MSVEIHEKRFQEELKRQAIWKEKTHEILRNLEASRNIEHQALQKTQGSFTLCNFVKRLLVFAKC